MKRQWLGILGIMVCLTAFVPGVCSAQEEMPEVRIEDAVVCQGIEDREPVGSSDTFPRDVSKLFCFSRVIGAPVNTEITHNWYFNGILQATILLRIGSDNWRTWSSKRLSSDQAGEWMVEVLSKDGTPLEYIIFFVK